MGKKSSSVEGGFRRMEVVLQCFHPGQARCGWRQLYPEPQNREGSTLDLGALDIYVTRQGS